jgi:carboxyl-terminal processing protease
MRAFRWFALCSLALCVLSLTWCTGPSRAQDKSDKPTPKVEKADKTPADDSKGEKSDEYYELMKLFVDTFEQIERNYVKDVDRRQLMQSAIRGMVTQLDPYSNYISPEELKRFNQEIEQEFGGIGIQVQEDPKSRRLMVMTPLPGTPAYKAGVKSGDIIFEIEGKSSEGVTLEEAVKILQGKPGTDVTIGVQHAGEEKIEQIKITRALIQVPTVLGDTHKPDDSWSFMLDGDSKIGYLRLTHFGRRSADELQEALESLQADGMKGLVLDMRFNPGGLLSQATKIADLFLEQGTIVSVKGRNSQDRSWTAEKEGTFSGFPMTVLINRFSASASEIVGAALQDHNRALLIGERSWGKGSVQNVIELDGGNSALKLTTAEYLRPNGKNIHKFPGSKDQDEWGVAPLKDHLIEFTTKELKDYLEYRRLRDVISKDGPPKAEFVDRQLNEAIAYLKSELSGENKDGGKKPDEKKVGDKKAEGSTK